MLGAVAGSATSVWYSSSAACRSRSIGGSVIGRIGLGRARSSSSVRTGGSTSCLAAIRRSTSFW